MRCTLLVVVASLLVACATQPPGGLIQPEDYMSPEAYLETVGLGKYSKADVLERVGTPDRKAKVEGRTYWTHLVSGADYRPRYTYIFEDDVLVDVRYNADGLSTIDGMTAKEAQASD